CQFYVSPGFLSEKMHVFLATELTETKQNLEDDEILTIERHSFDSLLNMIRNGEIEDAKTIVGIHSAHAEFTMRKPDREGGLGEHFN
ncbi:MAG TPA: NUDIX hydrolase, partial [Pyrinomonadaceae bacterium]|nr:NUDIX hydrolase [Pyrinomonadaceae bacterium]